MKKCVAFVAHGRSGNAWRPCRQPARSHSVFCRRHESVFAGVMLGVFVHRYPEPWEHAQVSALERMPVASREPS